jgi:Mg-chelatase subunit ChlD
MMNVVAPLPDSRRSRLALAIALLAHQLMASTAGATISSMSVSQAVQLDEATPSVRAFLDVLDEIGEPAAEIRSGQLSATLGQEVLELRESYPFRARAQGVAYVFLVDISRSLSLSEFQLILEALDVWILSLRPVDRVAVIAFGDESRLVLDFTDDRTAIQSALYSLGPSDNQTVLHEALKQGLELCDRRDPDLPGRRVLMVLTDGRDEGSGLTADDVLASLRRDPVPIYAIGVSSLRDPGLRRRYLDLLRRFAANSGGTFHEASTSSLGTAYEAIRKAIHGVWVADFTCPSCIPAGEEHRLQVQIEDNGKVLSSGRSLRLLPTRRLVTQSAPTPTADTDEGQIADDDASTVSEPGTEPATETDAADTEEASTPLWVRLLLIIALVFGLWWLLRRRRAPTREAEPPDLPPLPPLREATGPPVVSAKPSKPVTEPVSSTPPAQEPLPKPQTYTLESGVETTRPPRPAIMRLVRLVVVRGEKPGRQFTLTLFQNSVVGSRSTCDCVLTDPGVAREQFELFQLDGRVFIRNLDGSNPTLVEGEALTERSPLKSGALVGNRDFILRIVYEDARPVNT